MLALSAWPTLAQVPPPSAIPARDASTVTIDQPAAITREGMARAIAGLTRELVATRELADAQKAELEQADKIISLLREEKTAIQRQLQLLEDKAKAQANLTSAEREQKEALKLQVADLQKQLVKAESRAKGLVKAVARAFGVGFISGLLFGFKVF